MGRDEKARRQLAAIGKLPPGVIDFSQLGKDQIVKDSFHRELHVGDVVVAPKGESTYRITTITAATGPGVPPNLMRVDMVSIISVAVPRGAAIDGIMRVLTNTEAAAATGAQPPVEDPPEASREPQDAPPTPSEPREPLPDTEPSGFPPAPLDPRD